MSVQVLRLLLLNIFASNWLINLIKRENKSAALEWECREIREQIWELERRSILKNEWK